MVVMHPFVALMRRYVEDYTHAHDVSQIPRLTHPDYTIRIGGVSLGLDDYTEMVEDAFRRFPDLGIAVHDIVTNGDRLALHFSEYASSHKHGGPPAVWQGIGIYSRAADGRLSANSAEQDFYGRREQFFGAESPPPPVTDPEVWETRARPRNDETEGIVRAWAAARNDSPDRRRELEADGLRVVRNAGGSQGRMLDDRVTELDDLFSAGDRFGIKLVMRGRYAGNLYGTETSHGEPAHFAATGIGRVVEGKIAELHLVTDRFGLRQRLLG